MDEISKGDLDLLRLAIAASDRARQVGNHPFGAILAGVEGTVLLEAENTVITTRDPTAHAESNLVTMAHQRGLTAQTLAHTTLYASTEPCPMCSGAIYWGGIGRIVYGLSQERLYQLIGDESGGSQEFVLHCRDVLHHASSSVIVLGPALEDEAARVHTGFWTSA